jgi:hypothetical protein
MMARKATFEFRHVGAHPDDLDDGRQVAPGDLVELTEDQIREPRAQELIAIAVLLPTDEKAEEQARLASRRDSSADKREQQKEEERQQPQIEEGGK